MLTKSKLKKMREAFEANTETGKPERLAELGLAAVEALEKIRDTCETACDAGDGLLYIGELLEADMSSKS